MGTGRKLLLADDSITIQKVVTLTFVDEGLEVTTVGNGDLAIEKIEELNPDIVLADIHMPGRNGYEVCEFVKRNERFRHIPVMLLVGSFEPYDEAEARRVGANEHLTKPFQSIRNLVSKVGALLSGAPATDETPTRELVEDKEGPLDAREQSEASQAVDLEIPTGAETLEPVPYTYEAGGNDAFADPSLDDAMIEATPAGDFNLNQTIGTSRATTPLSSPKFEPPEADRHIPPTINTQDTLQMHSHEIAHEGSETHDLNTNQQMHYAGSDASDETLLDLGNDEPQLAGGGHDDSILDIWDDEPAAAAEPSSGPSDGQIVQYDGDVMELPPPSAGNVESEIVETEPIVEAAPATKATAVSREPARSSQGTPAHQGMITLEQLSPEVIDAVARRAVEQLSEKVVEQIAWEVVPELAERMIKRRIEQGGKL